MKKRYVERYIGTKKDAINIKGNWGDMWERIEESDGIYYQSTKGWKLHERFILLDVEKGYLEEYKPHSLSGYKASALQAEDHSFDPNMGYSYPNGGYTYGYGDMV